MVLEAVRKVFTYGPTLCFRCQGKLTHTVYPFIHQITNNMRHEDQIRPIKFPDIDTSDLPKNTRFSMTAGDFLDVYSTQENTGTWDCLVTCFFIDCSHNIVAVLERIYDCLKPGGIWINLGPLLYHFADMAGEDSIEPSFDFLVEIVKNLGFTIEVSYFHSFYVAEVLLSAFLMRCFDSFFL